MATAENRSARPPIHMIDTEARKLEDLALEIEDRFPHVSEMLLRETNRARVHRAENMPADVVTMGATVEFVDEGSGARRTVQLVWPAQADIQAGRISILTPIGAGLIGLREGQSIVWPDRDGHERVLVVLKVTQQPAVAQ